MTVIADVRDKLHRPASTGTQRCLPCTLLNIGILAAGITALARRQHRHLALVLTVVGTGAIWLRGYLLPYTPQFAPQLVAALGIGEYFHARDTRESLGDPGSLADRDRREPPGEGRDDEPDGDAVLATLVDSGVLVPDGEDLSLAPEVRKRWRAEIDASRALASADLAAELEESVPMVTDTRVIDDERAEREGRWIALGEGSEIATETWLSRPIAIAELAAIRALEASDLPLDARLAAARPLRMFLDRCPDCGGQVEASTTASCCGGLTAPRQGPQEVLACTECDERLFTFPRED